MVLTIILLRQIKKSQNLGGSCGGGTPVPIPNTAVKPASADDSRKAKVGRRQDFDSFFNTKKLLYVTAVCRVVRGSGRTLLFP